MATEGATLHLHTVRTGKQENVYMLEILIIPLDIFCLTENHSTMTLFDEP